MLLRVSSELQGEKVNLQSVTNGSEIQSGVRCQDELIRFAEAAIGHDEVKITEARQALREIMGDKAVVDAAGVIANFQRMVRIANGAGIPLDKPMALVSAPMRSELGLDNYASSVNTPELSLMQKILARLLNPLVPVLFKRIAKRVSGEEKAP